MMYRNERTSGRAACALPLIAAVLISMAAAAPAQDLFMQPASLVEAEAFASLSVFHPGSTGYIAVRASIEEEWHINSNKPLDKFLIPTVLKVKAPVGIEVVSILYPEPLLAKLELSSTDMSLYHGTVVFGAVIRISEELAPGEYEIRTDLDYQGCNDLTCLEPSTRRTAVKVRIGTLDETAELTHEDIFFSPPFVDSDGNPVTGAGGDPSFGGMIEEKGLFLAFILIFLGGLALNLTPCVYPLIPITISYFGGQAGGRASRTFFLTILYVLGISITYSVLGIFAAMTGSLFGAALQNPVVIFFIAAVLIGLATSMFGLWEIRVPTFLMTRTGSAKQGYLGALFMGLTVGIVAAPCIGPFVLGLLTYVGEMGRPVMGFLMFFTLAWGMGMPFIVLGMVSGSISRLPQSGNWMIWVRKIFGFILLTMAVYFARHITGAPVAYTAYAALTLAGGIYLGWIDRVPGMGRKFTLLRSTVGAAGVIAAVLLFTAPGGPVRKAKEVPGIDWKPFTAAAFEQARSAGSPVMIDFSADWCIPCHELDHRTFSDPRVIELSKSIVTLKVDLTRSGEKENVIKKDFAIRGAPTIIFYGRSGTEITGSRITGFVGPDRLLEEMKKLEAE